LSEFSNGLARQVYHIIFREGWKYWVTGAFINMINQLSKEGLIESEFHAPRRVNRLSPVGRQIAERILEVEKISAANLIQNE
jgi:hypothetical protein